MQHPAVLALRVEGRVQGVGFRWFVRERASALGLVGWVWNAPDGAVELCAAGDERRLAELRAIVERGPRGASVEQVRVLAPDRGAAQRTQFSILHGAERPHDLTPGARPGASESRDQS